MQYLVDRLWKAANVKEETTPGVVVLLKKLKEHASEFDNTLEKAREDGVIDQTEFDNLLERRTSLLSTAVDLTQQDAEITEEEFKLLDSLSKISLDSFTGE